MELRPSSSRPPLKRTLCGHLGGVECIALSPDGTKIVSGSEDRTWKVWDVGKGQCTATLDGGSSPHKHTQTIQGICYSPGDGSWLCTAGLDARVNIWEASTGSLFDEALSTEHRHGITCVTVTHDGAMIVTGGIDQLVRVWNIETNRCDLTLKGHGGRVNSLSVSKGPSPLLTSASSDGTVKVWALKAADPGIPQQDLRGHSKGVLCVDISVDGRYVVSGSMDGTARLWDLLPCQDMDLCIMTFRDHEGPVTGIDLCDARMWMVTCGMDGTVRLVDLDTGLCLRTMTGHTGPVTAVVIAWNGDFVASAGRDKTVRIWDCAVGSSVTNTEIGRAVRASEVAVSPDHKLLATANKDPSKQHISLWDLDSGIHDVDAPNRAKALLYCDPELALPRSPETRNISSPPQPINVTHLAFTRDGKFLVAATDNKRASIWIWRVTDGKMVRVISNGGQRVDSMDVSTLLVAAGCKNGKIRVWAHADVPRGAEPEHVSVFSCSERVCEAVALSGYERSLAAAVQYKVLVWSICKPDAPPRELLGHTEYVNCVCFHPQREMLVSGSRDATIRVWDLEENSNNSSKGPPSVVLEGHSAGVKTVLALPSSLIISSGDDQCVKVWRAGQCTSTLEGNRRTSLTSIAAPADGTMVATVSEDHELCLWDLEQQPSREEIWELMEEARSDPKDQRFWHVIEANPGLVLENSRCGGSKEGLQNLLHYLVWHDVDDFVIRILNHCPHAVFAKDLALQSSDKGQRLDDNSKKSIPLLRRVLLRRSTSVTVTLLTRMAALLTDPQALRNPRRCFESLKVADLCEVMTEIPDLCTTALRPLLNLQASAPGVSSGCSRRMLSKGETWTGGSQTLSPTAFWKDRFSTQLPTEQSPPPVVESTILWRFWMMVLRREKKQRHRRHGRRHKSRRGQTAVHIVTDEMLAGPDKSLRSTLQRISYHVPELDEKSLHDRAGILVRPSFVGIMNCAGPPYSHDEQGAHSFLQAAVDLCYKLGNAAIFETDVLIAILAFKWNAYARFMHIQELCLYLAFLGLFSSSCFYLPHMDSVGIRWAWELVILALSAFFWHREYLQLTHQGVQRYLGDSWNYVDMVTYGLCFATFIARAVDHTSNTAAILGATALLPAWFKCLFYMRAFSSTGVMIRTIFEVIKNIRYFFLIVLLVIIGFSQFYFIMLTSNHGDPMDDQSPSLAATFVAVFLFNLGVYNPDPSEFDAARSPQLTYVFYTVFMVVNGVVFLNILIAIMGDAFNRVQAHAVLEWRLEQACIILQMESMMSAKYFQREDLFPRWLQVLRAADWNEDQGSFDGWSGAIGALNKRITLLERRLDDKMEQNEKRVFKSLAAVGNAVESVEKMMSQRLDGLTKATEAHDAGIQDVAIELQKLGSLSKQLLREAQVTARGDGGSCKEQSGTEGRLSDHLVATLEDDFSFTTRPLHMKRSIRSTTGGDGGGHPLSPVGLATTRGGAINGTYRMAAPDRMFKTAGTYSIADVNGEDDDEDSHNHSPGDDGDDDDDEEDSDDRDGLGGIVAVPALATPGPVLPAAKPAEKALSTSPMVITVTTRSPPELGTLTEMAANADSRQSPRPEAAAKDGGSGGPQSQPEKPVVKRSPDSAKRELATLSNDGDDYLNDNSFF